MRVSKATIVSGAVALTAMLPLAASAQPQTDFSQTENRIDTAERANRMRTSTEAVRNAGTSRAATENLANLNLGVFFVTVPGRLLSVPPPLQELELPRIVGGLDSRGGRHAQYGVLDEKSSFSVATTAGKFRVPGAPAPVRPDPVKEGTRVYFVLPVRILRGGTSHEYQTAKRLASYDWDGTLNMPYYLTDRSGRVNKGRLRIKNAVIARLDRVIVRGEPFVVATLLPLGGSLDVNRIDAAVASSRHGRPTYKGSLTHIHSPHGNDGVGPFWAIDDKGTRFATDHIGTVTARISQSLTTRGRKQVNATTGYLQYQFTSDRYPVQILGSIQHRQIWAGNHTIDGGVEVDYLFAPLQWLFSVNGTYELVSGTPKQTGWLGSAGVTIPILAPRDRTTVQFAYQLPSHLQGIATYSVALVKGFTPRVAGVVEYDQGGTYKALLSYKF